MLVTIQAHAKSLHPQYCGRSSCIEGKAAFMLYASLALLALGTGGVRGVLPSLGADQFDQNNPKEAKALATYFNWLTLSTVLGASVGTYNFDSKCRFIIIYVFNTHRSLQKITMKSNVSRSI